jgi:hypothetical protein
MPTISRQFVNRADGYGSPWVDPTPKPTPTITFKPKPTPKPTPKLTNKPKLQTDGNTLQYVPVGSGASAAIGGFLGGGSGAFGTLN